MSYEIYTDGSCIGNPGPGGWGFLVVDVSISTDDGPGDAVVHQDSGSESEATNNRMEMLAFIKALEYAVEQDYEKAVVYSDSQLLVNTLNQGWKRKANLDLWLEIEALLSKIPLEISWVKAHAKNHYNNMVDQLAFKAAEKA